MRGAKNLDGALHRRGLPMSRFGVIVVTAVLVASCSGDGGGAGGDGAGSTDDRELFNDEVDGVRAMVADCFVSEGSGDGPRHVTTVEVVNQSSSAHTITVTIDTDRGRGGVSDAFEVPAGATDAWAVESTEETTDPVGDVECGDYITGVEVTLDP